MAAVTVSVVIVNYRTPGLTIRALRSALDDGASQVVVVDNASGDDSLDRLRAIVDDRLFVVASPTNGGFGSGANQGAAAATADVLVFLNSDAYARRGALSALADALDAHRGCAIIGPRLIGNDGVVQRSAGLVPRPDDLLIRGLGLHHVARSLAHFPLVSRLLGRQRIATEYDQAITATEAIDVSMVSGACLAIGWEAFQELGGFDEGYFMYFEDADLCRRAAAAGWPIRYVPSAVVEHVGGASAPGDYRFGPWHAASMVRYLRRWHGASGAVIGIGILWARTIGSIAGDQAARERAAAALRVGLSTAIANGR